MKYIFGFLSVVSTMAFVVACGNSSNSNNSTDPNAVVNFGCVAGSTFNNGQCLNSSNQVVQSGIGFKSANIINTMTVTNNSLFQRFLSEAMAVCNQSSYNFGASNCSGYNGSNVAIQAVLQSIDVSSNTVRLTVQVQNLSASNSWFSVNFATNPSVPQNPLALNMQVGLINNSQGFQAQTNGPAFTGSALHVIQFIVTNGKLSDGYFDYKLSYDGTAGGVFLTGRMNRCGEATCSLSQYY